MSSTYAGNDVFPADFLVPDDGDDESASPVNIPDEALADRTKYLFNRGGAGALATLAALTAITTPSNGWMRFVKNYGYFLFDSASVLAASSPYILVPDDVTPGRWLHESLALRNLPNGIAGLDPDSQLTIFGGGPGYPVFSAARTHITSMPTHGAMYKNPSTGAVPAPDKTVLFNGTQEATSDYRWINGVQYINLVGGALLYPLNALLHNGATLSSVLVNVQAPAGHGALPAHPISVGLFRRPINALALSSMVLAGDFTVDPSGTVGAYEAAHSFTITPDTLNVIDKSTNDYYLMVFGECGVGAIANSLIIGVKLTMSAITDMRFA